MTSVNVTTTKNTVTVNGETRVVTVKTQGPQGPSLPDGDKGDVTVSSNGTAISINNSAVTSAKIADGAIVDADINASAAIALTKLATGALPTAITVTSANISDLSIVDADINASAAIAGTKISPDFGSQNIVTTGTAATGALGVTGNLTVSGTVDGRDLSVDGAKLDGIESGATADQTKSDIDALGIAASTATTLATARTIAGTSFDGSANIDISYTNLTNKLSVGDGGLTQNNFTDALKTKLDGVETGATADQTASEIVALIADQTIAPSTIDMEDNEKIKLGTGDDLEIYHDPSSGSGLNYIKAVSGYMMIQQQGNGSSITVAATHVYLKNHNNNETFLYGVNNGSVDLYYDNSKKLETTSTGVKITGTGTNTVEINGTGGHELYSYHDSGGVGWATGASTNYGELLYLNESGSKIHLYAGGVERLKVDSSGASVTGNIAVSGTVDGVDIATRDTLFGGLTSSSGVLTNGVTATTQSASDNSTKVATTAYTDTAIANLVNSAPSTLDTLGEIATALNNDAALNTTLTNSIATKLPLAGGTLTGDLTLTSAAPAINFVDDGDNPDYRIVTNSGQFKVQDTTNSNANRLLIQQANTRITNNLLADGGIDVTGNISVTGTVDGRDVASDGSKLDGIEASATADQTASEIVALVADQTIAPSEIDMEDNEKILLGTGDDLEIYHSSDISRIRNTNDSGTLKIQATSNGENAINIVPNGTTELYFDGTKKFETTASGIQIASAGTGRTLYIEQQQDADSEAIAIRQFGTESQSATNVSFLNHSGNEIGSIESSSSAVDYKTDDGGKLRLGTGSDFSIFHNGTNNVLSTDNGQVQIVKGASENIAKFIPDGAVELYYDNSKKFETYSNGVRAANNGHIKLASDSGKFFMGAGDDAELFHDGTNLTLNGDGTNATFLRAKSGENSIKLIPDGAVELYYDNGKKLETTSTGALIDGKLETTGLTRAGDITFERSGNTRLTVDNGGITVGGDIKYNDNYKIKAGTGADLEIYHDGSNSNIKSITNDLFIRSNSSDDKAIVVRNGAGVDLYYDNAKKLETTTNGITMSGHIDLPDQKEVRIGGASLRLRHDGHSIIQNDESGACMFITSHETQFANTGLTEAQAKFFQDGAVELFYDNGKKLETTSAGISVTGQVNSDGSHMGDNDKAIFGNSNDLQIYHDGSENAINMTDTNHDLRIFGVSGSSIKLEPRSGHSSAVFKSNNAVELYYDNDKKFETASIGVYSKSIMPSSHETYDIGQNMGRWNNIYIADSGKLRIGQGDDLQIYHNGSHSFIDDVGTGDMYIRGDNALKIQNAAGSEQKIVANSNGSVDLYYDHSKKFETTSAGVEVTGNVTFAGDSNTHISHPQADYLKITTGGNEVMSFTDASNIFIPDSRKLMFGDNVDLQIYHDGTNSFIQDTGTGDLYVRTSKINIQGANGDNEIVATQDGAVELYHDNSKKLETTSTGVTVTGTVTETSDIALKSNIQPLTNTLEKIQQITGYKYNLINSISPSMGVIAQDVEKVFPELVHGSQGKKTLQYSGLIGVLIEAVKDLSAKVAALEAE